MKHSCGEYALIFKALSDETRLRIFSMLSDEEICACHILSEVNISQPTLSYHMKLLCGCGLVNARKDGSWMWYTINTDRVSELQAFLQETKKPKEKKYDNTGCC